MQQVGKRTIGTGNSGSYYSGTDHSNKIKLCHWSTRKKCKIWMSNWQVVTLDSVRTSFHFGFDFVAFVNIVVGLLRSKSTMETVPYHCQFVVLRSKQCRLWLMRPMREWQSLPHEEQLWIDAAESVVVFSSRLAPFSMVSLVKFSSPSFS